MGGGQWQIWISKKEKKCWPVSDLINGSLGSAQHLRRELGRSQNIILQSYYLGAEVQHFEWIFMDAFFSFLFLHVWIFPFSQINLFAYHKWQIIIVWIAISELCRGIVLNCNKWNWHKRQQSLTAVNKLFKATYLAFKWRITSTSCWF